MKPPSFLTKDRAQRQLQKDHFTGQRILHTCSKRSWSNIPLCTAESRQDKAATFPIQGRKRLGNSHQVGSPVTRETRAGAGGKDAAPDEAQ